MPDGNNNGVEASTQWGALKVTGPVALVIVALLVIIALLFAALFGWISTPVTQMLEILRSQTSILQHHLEDTNEYRSENQRALNYQNMLMRALCYRLSDTKEQAMQCEPEYRGYPEENLKYYDRPKSKR